MVHTPPPRVPARPLAHPAAEVEWPGWSVGRLRGACGQQVRVRALNAEAATSNRFCVTTLLRKRFPRKAQRAGPRASGLGPAAASGVTPAHGRRAHRLLSLFPGGVQSSVYAVTPFLWKPTQ